MFRSAGGLAAGALFKTCRRQRPPALLRSDRFRDFLHTGSEMFIPRQEAHAGVPTQNRIVIARRSQPLRLLKQLHGTHDPLVHVMMCSLAAALAASLGAAFPGDTRVVCPIVGR